MDKLRQSRCGDRPLSISELVPGQTTVAYKLQRQHVSHVPLKPFAVSEKYTKYGIYTKYHICVVWARSLLNAVWDIKVTEDRAGSHKNFSVEDEGRMEKKYIFKQEE